MIEEKDTLEGNSVEDKKLKPVVFADSKDPFHRPNFLKQKMLAEALLVTQDREKLAEMIHAKDVAEVDRTFDVLVNQKNFKASMRKSGLDTDYIATSLKGIIDNAAKDSDKLTGLRLVMEAQGIKKMEQSAADIANWQDLVIAKAEELRNIVEGEIVEDDEIDLYEVKAPELPAFMRNRDSSIEGSHGQSAVEDVVDETLKKIYE